MPSLRVLKRTSAKNLVRKIASRIKLLLLWHQKRRSIQMRATELQFPLRICKTGAARNEGIRTGKCFDKHFACQYWEVKLKFVKTWQVSDLQITSHKKLETDEEETLFAELARSISHQKVGSKGRRGVPQNRRVAMPGYPEEPCTPSDMQALKKFVQAGTAWHPKSNMIVQRHHAFAGIRTSIHSWNHQHRQPYYPLRQKAESRWPGRHGRSANPSCAGNNKVYLRLVNTSTKLPCPKTRIVL